jgi:hypothetical protein
MPVNARPAAPPTCTPAGRLYRRLPQMALDTARKLGIYVPRCSALDISARAA